VYIANIPTLFDRMLDWNRQMDEAATARSMASFADTPARTQLWIPAVDLYETENAFVIEADLPGVHQENVDIQFDRGSLTITGTRAATLPAQRETGELRVYTSERVSGTFSRSIRLPEHVDPEHTQAVYAHGVLRVTVPKSKGALPRKIAIKAAESAPELGSEAK
jgi:HSP20 family protein